MKRIFVFVFLLECVQLRAADVAISDMTLNTNPSTNTFIEISDMNATPKSGKYLLTNLVTKSTSDSTYVKKSGDTMTGALAIGNGTITASTPVLDLSQTLNNAGVTFTALKLNIADTASASGSLLMDLQVGGSGKFSIRKDGAIIAGSSTLTPSSGNWTSAGDVRASGSVRSIGSIYLGSSYATVLVPEADNTIALRNGVNAQTFNIYNTYTDASNYERAGFGWSGGSFLITTAKAGTGSNRDLGVYAASELYLGASSAPKWKISTTGHLLAQADNTYDIGASGATRPRSIYVGTAVISPLVKPADSSGTDTAGVGLVIQGGVSTGAGRGGSVVVKTSTSSTTGTSANSAQERAHYVPKFVDLTDNTATTIFTVTLPATNSIGMSFTCTVQAGDGTDFQSLTTPVTIDAVAKTTTITAVVAPTSAQTALAGSSGTLSVTYTVVDAGSNVLAVKCTADTSLTSTYLRAKIVMTGINGMGAGWVINEI